MRGAKPMWAVANDLAASAAYALASSADRIWLTRTAGVGSVGVFALHADQSGLDGQAGVKYTYIYAGEKKTDGNPHEALSKSAKADIQDEVDRENDIFLATVARNRGFAGANIARVAGDQGRSLLRAERDSAPRRRGRDVRRGARGADGESQRDQADTLWKSCIADRSGQ